MLTARSAACLSLLLLAAAQQQSPRACLPLLQPGTLFGAAGGATTGDDRETALFQAVVQRGATLSQISIPWHTLESVPGVIDTAMAARVLQQARNNGLIPVFQVAAIDTERVSVPPDLAHPSDPTLLAPGLTWQSPQVLDRFAVVLQSVAPLGVYYGSPYIGLGNEVDVNLRDHPETAYDFAVFVKSLGDYVRTLTSADVATGVTMTIAGINTMPSPPPPWFSLLVDVSDVIPLTYYPLSADFTVKSPDVVAGDLAMAAGQLPPNMAVALQEFGYPSGYGNASSTDRSSEALQAQFYSNMLSALRTLNETNISPGAGQPACGRVRLASAFGFADMPADVCESFAPYYNVSSPAFIEYVCTLGLVHNAAQNATAKLAYYAFLSGL